MQPAQAPERFRLAVKASTLPAKIAARRIDRGRRFMVGRQARVMGKAGMTETRPRTPPTFEQLRTMSGQELGVSDWTTIDQQRIDQFAECTGDHQWIHVDPERAKRQSPFRTTIAHGYLTLSIIGALALEMGIVPENTQAAFNYGFDKVRFLAPVRVGARIRLRTTLLSMEDRGPGQYLMKAANTVEIEGEQKPALTAETLVMMYERRKRA
jgi:acyl dehydratase